MNVRLRVTTANNLLSKGAMPLSPENRSRIVLVLSFFLASSLANLALVAVVVKHWAEVKRNPSTTLSFNLILGVFIFGLAGVPINVEKLVRDELNQTGSFFCQLEGAFITFGGAATIVGNIIIAVERYLVMLCNRKLSLLEVGRLSAAGWVWIFTLALLPIILPDGSYAMQASEVYCLGEWWGTKPAVLVPVYLDAATCVGGLLFISYVYGRIALMIYRQRKNLKSADVVITLPSKEEGETQVKIRASNTLSVGETDFFTPSSQGMNSAPLSPALPVSPGKHLAPLALAKRPSIRPSANRQGISKKDRYIYFKVVAIAGGYVFFWGPFGVIMLTGILGKSMMSPQYCITAGLLVIFGGVVNAAIMGFLDPVYKKYLAQALKHWIPLFRQPIPEPVAGDM